MSSNHHTPYTFHAALKATVMNVPLGQLDQTITDMLDGSQEFSGLKVGAGALHASAAAQIDSTTKGFLGVPRMTTAQRDAIATPPEGLLIWNTTTHALNYYESSWKAISDSAGAMTELVPTTALSNTASISMTSLSSSFQDLILRLRVRSTVAAVTDSLRLRFNNDSGATNYVWNQYYAATSSINNVNDASDDGVDILCPGASATSGRFLDIVLHLLSYTEGTNKVGGWYRGALAENTFYATWGAFEWVGGAAINRIDFQALAGNMNGSYALYGVG